MNATQPTEVNDVLQLADDTVNSRTFVEAQAYYSARSTSYDKQHEILGFIPPKEAAKACLKYALNNKSTTILDLCGGTGNVALQLRDQGFVGIIDILDANIHMLYEASKKPIDFRSIICHKIDGKLPVFEQSYDAVTAIACFFESHLTPKVFEPIFEVIKPGGHFIFNLKNRNLTDYDDRLKEELLRLESIGLMKRVEEYVISGYKNKDGITTRNFVCVKL